jgi:hypothetical protein
VLVDLFENGRVNDDYVLLLSCFWGYFVAFDFVLLVETKSVESSQICCGELLAEERVLYFGEIFLEQFYFDRLLYFGEDVCHVFLEGIDWLIFTRGCGER